MAPPSTPSPCPPSATVYGISNCDTVKKARDWLSTAGVDYQFHDFKKAGVPDAALEDWLQALGWEALVNRKGTTWRKLDPALQAATQDASSASALMLAHPSVIKRPVVCWPDGALSVGFSPALFAARHEASDRV
ncbi:MAG: ArsC family reductase [Betaproteobacteria bacterium]